MYRITLVTFAILFFKSFFFLLASSAFSKPIVDKLTFAAILYYVKVYAFVDDKCIGSL